MTYEQLVAFIQNRMRMSHVYQPVMLVALLQGGGRCSTTEIARAILTHDESQIEYYEDVTKNMVGRVLRRHGIVEREDGGYALVGYENLDEEQIEYLIGLCESKLDEYKERRGKRIWQHRRVSGGYISGTLRYEVLKRARFRCELCGVSADVRALEVDHIVPRNRGGTDNPDNLQALCYSCNSMKRDRDATDFRGVRESYVERRVVANSTPFDWCITLLLPLPLSRRVLRPMSMMPPGEVQCIQRRAIHPLRGRCVLGNPSRRQHAPPRVIVNLTTD